MATKGRTISETTRARMRAAAHRRIKERPWTNPAGLYTPPKGTHTSPATEFKKGVTPKNSLVFVATGLTFKGSLKEYKALHHRITKKLGSPKLCSSCGDTKAKKYHWANVSGQYLENNSDWIRLCVKCHYYFDGKDEKKERHRS